MQSKKWLVYYKTFFGLLGLSAVMTEIIVISARGNFNPANFFSYFTIESNIIAAFSLLIGAWMVSRRKSGTGLALLRGAATLYMVMTGVVFAILLSGYESLTALPWDNIVLHYIMPVALLVDWLIDPPKVTLTWRRALIWLAYPLTYLAYSLIRGSIVGWYPYPFLNPDKNGYVGVVLISLAITVVALGVVWLLLRRMRKLS